MSSNHVRPNQRVYIYREQKEKKSQVRMSPNTLEYRRITACSKDVGSRREGGRGQCVREKEVAPLVWCAERSGDRGRGDRGGRKGVGEIRRRRRFLYVQKVCAMLPCHNVSCHYYYFPLLFFSLYNLRKHTFIKVCYMLEGKGEGGGGVCNISFQSHQSPPPIKSRERDGEREKE